MYTGVLNAFQRVDYLLRAFAVALQSQPNALLLIVSPLVNATNEKEHKELAAELGIAQSIIWVAPHALADLPSYLALADVTVVPRPECPGHPVKLLNYMLAGKPVVSFAGGAKGVRHLHDAFIVPNHDYEALGSGIVTLLEDRALATELAANGRATVLADFDWRQICRKIERIYDRLLGAPAPAPRLNESPAPATVEH
jgi:glycosyltransferase involved in cell wall biosynthesis